MSLSPSVGNAAGSDGGAPGYARHRPEQTLLYRLVSCASAPTGRASTSSTVSLATSPAER